MSFLRDPYRVIPLVAILVIVVMMIYPSNWTNIESMRQSLKEKLPQGSSKAEVIRFLESDDWRYGDDEESIGALLPDTGRRQFYIRVDLQVRFEFDLDGKLVSTSLREVYTGF